VLTTVTRKLQLGPPETVEFTVVVPTGKNDPDAGEAETVPHVPAVSAAEKVTIAPGLFCASTALVPTVMLSGQVTVQAGGAGLETVASADESLFVERRSVVLLDAVAVEVVVVPPEFELI
jgi:hypothetical protein